MQAIDCIAASGLQVVQFQIPYSQVIKEFRWLRIREALAADRCGSKRQDTRVVITADKKCHAALVWFGDSLAVWWRGGGMQGDTFTHQSTSILSN